MSRHPLQIAEVESGPRRTLALAEALAVRGRYQLQVFVRDNNVDQALRILKKKMQREGVFREMKQRRSYEKPSERKTREKSEAIRRARKLARKKAQREGLIPPDARKKKLLDAKKAGQRPTLRPFPSF
jgi:small subunit ribosomal protein S21